MSTETTEIIAREAQGGDERGSPLHPSNVLHNLKLIVDLLERYCYYYQLKMPALRTLLDLSHHWEYSGKGMTIYELCLVKSQKAGEPQSYYVSIRDQVEIMLRKGLVERIGRSSKGADIYVPTNKVLSEIRYIGSMVRE